jgi:hypothetical protein
MMSTLFLASLCLPAPLAYVGPGPGLSMLGALIGLVATLAIALLAVALWPLRVLMRRLRQRRAAPAAAELGDS